MQRSLCVRTGVYVAAFAAALCISFVVEPFVTIAQAREPDRTLKIQFTHTGEKGEFTFKRNGRYDRAVLDKLNKITRDWRRNEPTRMDPQLFDLLWEIYQKTGSKEYIRVVSGYRSLKTNNMLRRRSRAVAKRSRHTQGRAIDFFIPGVPVSKIRKIGLKIEKGGVGYYPSSRSPFIHIDTGSIRHWPRMSSKQLAAVFPNGGTLHVPSNGKPLPGYKRALARAGKAGKTAKTTAIAYLDPKTHSIRAKDNRPKKVTVGKWLKKVFNGGADEEEDNALAGIGTAPGKQRKPPVSPAAPLDPEFVVAGASPGSNDGLLPAPLPRNLPSRKRMILVAAAERSQVAAADELAMLALAAPPRTPSARAAPFPPSKAHENTLARFDIASFTGNGSAITTPDRSALATLYLAAARRAAALAPPGRAPVLLLTAALPTAKRRQEPTAKRHQEPSVATFPSYVLAAEIPAPSQASYSLASVENAPMPAPAARSARSLATRPPAAIPRAAPPASAAADAPGSAITAASALGLMGTLGPQSTNPVNRPVNQPVNRIELAYASVSATPLDGLATGPRPRRKPATADATGPANGANTGSAPAYPAVTLNAHLTSVAPGTDDLRRLLSQLTTRTREFAIFKRPRPDRVPGFYIAPNTAAEAILTASIKPPRTDHFAIEGNRLRTRFLPPRLAGLY